MKKLRLKSLDKNDLLSSNSVRKKEKIENKEKKKRRKEEKKKTKKKRKEENKENKEKKNKRKIRSLKIKISFSFSKLNILFLELTKELLLFHIFKTKRLFTLILLEISKQK